MSLTLKGIGYTYSPGTSFSVTALDAVDLSVSAGELVLVVGATGTGKSTLLRLAAGLLSPTSGFAEIDGQPLTPASARGRVGLVFQDAEAQLFADTVLQDVAFGPRNMGAAADEAQLMATAALREVGLDPEVYGDRSPFALSGGEARRVAIAGVLAMRPGYLLADEPTSGLDANGRRAVRAVFQRVRAETGLVVVSHSPEEFLDSADRILVLSGSTQAWCGGRPELLDEPGILTRAGLRVPEVLEVQERLAQVGHRVADRTVVPEVAAERILAVMRGAQ